MFVAAPALAEGRTITDAAGRSVTINDTARIVSIGGSVTEILYAMGLENQVIAVDLTSDFPARTVEKESVGYMRALSPEGVLSVNPSLVLAIEGSGPKEAIDVLEKASVPFVIVPEAHDADGVARKIRFVAAAVGQPERGETLAEAVSADLAAVAAARPTEDRRKAVFLLSISGGSPQAAGQKTSADAVFTLAGVDNALSGFNGFKAAKEEIVLAAEPDAVVVMAERSTAMSAETIFALPAFAHSPAAQAQRVVSLPGSYLLGFGPRTAHAVHDLAAGIYPERALPALPPRPWTQQGAP
jgi:iron complex transport system substrate-binding protein